MGDERMSNAATWPVQDDTGEGLDHPISLGTMIGSIWRDSVRFREQSA